MIQNDVMKKPMYRNNQSINRLETEQQTMTTQGISRLILVPFLLCFPCMASCMQEVPAPKQKEVHTAFVVLDSTTSTNIEDRCYELGARVRGYLERSKRLELAVFATGDAKTGFEPAAIVPWMRFEPQAKLFERPGAVKEMRDAWLGGIVETCQRTIKASTASSIYRPLHRAVESLRARCAELASQGERCKKSLGIHSDLRENVNRAIACRLCGKGSTGRKKNRCSQQPLPVLKTEGIQIGICGVSNTRGAAVTPPETIGKVWGEVLGKKELLLNASCPKMQKTSTREGSR